MFDEMLLMRAKRTDGKGWAHGYYVRLTDPNKNKQSPRIYTGYAEAEEDDEMYADWFEVDPDTLGFCTGLRDSEGELVYQGDIVSYPMTCGPFKNKDLFEVVREDRGGSAYFGIKMDDIETWPFGMEVPTKLMKVETNIYEKKGI